MCIRDSTIGAHTLKQGATIKIADNSLTFTCSMDANGSNHTYPRSTDPVSGASIPITGVTDTTININVGKSPLVKYNVTNATYNPTSGDMVLTIGTAHGLTANTSIKIATESLWFTCDYNSDGNTTIKKYPRASGASTTGNAGADYAYNTSVSITAADQAAGTITVLSLILI